jgi:hypothetical protein
MTSLADAGTRGVAAPVAVIASGAGRYTDPWHPYAETSEALAGILRESGWHVDVVADPDAALTALEGVDLLVVNAGDPWRNDAAARGADPAARAGLDAAIDRGIGIIAAHSALSSLRDYPAWRRVIGGAWIEGRSWHPEIGTATLRAVDDADGIVRGDIVVFDERYSDLEVDAGVRVLAVHDVDGAAHPAVWTHEGGGTRAVVSSLGHDARSYESAEHRALLARAARWAARRD